MPLYVMLHTKIKILENCLVDQCTVIKRNLSEMNLLNLPGEVATTISENVTNTVVTVPEVTTCSSHVTDLIELQIDSALTLNFCKYPRTKRSTDGEIIIHKRKFAAREERFMTLVAYKN